ncbi:MAG TPA: leucyl/phenylalanyl-tRNA--protein transferase [Alphaproteobacteria bacterium]|nr:MAG: leucyl/phenylalanyl-tRNA--protein transferase [SAR116 cluster bacterium]HBQ22177.1 leucyl/phenylalanyl-tRNA--protein transferase [Alphaproteobacteria bacterium]HCJ62604.1 leucyl/phenylalanyl-tRNA--protein transferase [Alphaproteobacteria bacterium]HCY47683.1 leucyl/phenylalanyl-tRNA--protein transferase [Alphaproteobacteria bacterium]|tara:strand:+ start:963 stop:1649 length:687 start_codon:yes stop_codon:yes gene_type:complete
MTSGQATRDAFDMLTAYRQGIFPMAEARDSKEYDWFTCERRGVIPLDGFYCPKSLRKTIRKGEYRIGLNSQFSNLLDHCAAREDGTWISLRLQNAYDILREMGHGLSVEVFYGDDLVGGLFGVSLGGAFFGESMVSLKPEASKIALVHLVLGMRAAGYHLLDTQTTTDHLIRFGQIGVHQDDYKKRLADALFIKPDELISAITETLVEPDLESISDKSVRYSLPENTA